MSWVCSICGSSRILQGSIQASLGDAAHPLGLCMDCRGAAPMPTDKTRPVPVKPIKQPLSPLCRADEYRERARRPKAAMPEDLFGGLSDEDRRALARPLR